MTTIEAPRIAGRDRARADVEDLDLAAGSTLIVSFPPRASGTPSYLDELVAVVCGERRARLVLRGLSEHAQRIALEVAARQQVDDLLEVQR